MQTHSSHTLQHSVSLSIIEQAASLLFTSLTLWPNWNKGHATPPLSRPSAAQELLILSLGLQWCSPPPPRVSLQLNQATPADISVLKLGVSLRLHGRLNVVGQRIGCLSPKGWSLVRHSLKPNVAHVRQTKEWGKLVFIES